MENVERSFFLYYKRNERVNQSTRCASTVVPNYLSYCSKSITGYARFHQMHTLHQQRQNRDVLRAKSRTPFITAEPL